MPLFGCGPAMMPVRAHPVPSPGTPHPPLMVGWGDGPPPPALHVLCWVRGDFVEFYECPLPPIPVPYMHAQGGMPGPAGEEAANVQTQF